VVDRSLETHLDKHDSFYLVTGGTGSIGQEIVKQLLTSGYPVRVLSRDEAKQYEMRKLFPDSRLSFQVGDVRCYGDVLKATKGVTHIIHAAAMKHVPTCEYEPLEAVRTNINGTANVIRAATVREVRSVVGISTDKACNPSSVMGMTKAVMERLLVEANLHTDKTRFNAVRFGNVVPSRGSVVPLFLEKIKRGEALTVTHPHMTRFLFSVKEAAHDAIMVSRMPATIKGVVFVRKLKSAYITDVATALIGQRNIPITYTGIRPGEKLSEELVSEDEASHTADCVDYLLIDPLLKEIRAIPNHIEGAYSSRYPLMTLPELREMLKRALGKEWPNGD
jgi:UDP-glucose 4-epimerase